MASEFFPWQFLDVGLSVSERGRVSLGIDYVDEDFGNDTEHHESSSEDDLPLSKLKVTITEVKNDKPLNEKEPEDVPEAAIGRLEDFVKRMEDEPNDQVPSGLPSNFAPVYAIMAPVSSGTTAVSFQPIGALVPLQSESVRNLFSEGKPVFALVPEKAGNVSASLGDLGLQQVKVRKRALSAPFGHEKGKEEPPRKLSFSAFNDVSVTSGKSKYVDMHPALAAIQHVRQKTNAKTERSPGRGFEAQKSVQLSKVVGITTEIYDVYGVHSTFPGIGRKRQQSNTKAIETSDIEMHPALAAIQRQPQQPPTKLIKSEPDSSQGSRGPCPNCQEPFSSRQGLFNHLKEVHPKLLQRAYCTLCDHFFTNSSSLKYHQTKFHMNRPDGSACRCKHCASVRRGDSYISYCLVCGEESFDSQECYRNHIVGHLHDEIALTKKKPGQSQFKVYRSSSKRAVMESRRHSANSGLGDILRSIKEPDTRMFPCRRCDKAFGLACLLFSHIGNCHCASHPAFV